eukprot:36846-Pelagomonas_calceolata.AAC.2
MHGGGNLEGLRLTHTSACQGELVGNETGTGYMLQGRGTWVAGKARSKGPEKIRALGDACHTERAFVMPWLNSDFRRHTSALATPQSCAQEASSCQPGTG